ncbi:hypothetical protein FFLO_01011 [Filobasidium floriforme]|uniref:BTB domain-containing protein n=1 Tax=Filobasidium floriforme TaxID=5210 RepID=A0A8K0NT83_9TREE|nr:hypothetical protein FFLO_01011 [Filobasidium floriforme]
MDDEQEWTLRCPGNKLVVVTRKVLLLSPVFRDMMDIGESPTVGRNDDDQRPQKKSRIDKAQEEILVEDDPTTLKCMFDLLTDLKRLKRPVSKPSTWLGTLKIADKYDYSVYEPIFIGCLWEWAAEGNRSALDVYGVAVELKHGALARYAARKYGGHALRTNAPRPVTWSLYSVEHVGFRAWYHLVQAGEECKPFAWDKVADHLVLPAEWDGTNSR